MSQDAQSPAEHAEGVFSRPSAQHGQLVDRLMAKIADLEAKLYQQELQHGGDLIPAGRASVDGSRSPSAVGARGAGAHQGPSQGAQEWIGAMASLIKRSSAWTGGAPASPSHMAAEGQQAAHDHDAAGPAQPEHAQAEPPGGRHVPMAPGSWRHYLSSRYVTVDPKDLQAELEASHQVRKAAYEAVQEADDRVAAAEARLAAAEAARRQLQLQLDQAAGITAEVEALKAENLEAWQTKRVLEAEMAGVKGQLEGFSRQGDSLQQELSHLRAQAALWQGASSDEAETLRAEGQLLRQQLAERGSEAAGLHMRLAEAQAASDALKQECVRLVEDCGKAQQQVAELQPLQAALREAGQREEEARREAAAAQDMFVKERAVRRKLHEQLQALRGNIRVLCRVRPALPAKQPIVSFPLEGMLAVADASSGRTREFEFDVVFGPSATQEAVFAEVVPLVRSCADGYNVCIFAYGQTGSGKTHTMQGSQEQPGINTRALAELFRITAEEPDKGWALSVAMIEIYNDAVYDLLGAVAKDPRPLDVNGLGAGELPANMDRVQGLCWRPVTAPAEVQALLLEGNGARATATTALNEASSRSHAVLSIKVCQQEAASAGPAPGAAVDAGASSRPAGPGGKRVTSLLHLVDLAGSERVDRSEVAGQQLKEAQAINKSLSALGDVISALQKRSPHIPFRNSKLTQVLQDSLCGSSKVLLVCQLSPEGASCPETLSSLNFASRAAQVELGPARRATSERPASPAGSAGSAASEPGPASPSRSPSRLGASSVRPAGAAGSSSPTPPKVPTVMMKPARH